MDDWQAVASWYPPVIFLGGGGWGFAGHGYGHLIARVPRLGSVCVVLRPVRAGRRWSRRWTMTRSARRRRARGEETGRRANSDTDCAKTPRRCSAHPSGRNWMKDYCAWPRCIPCPRSTTASLCTMFVQPSALLVVERAVLIVWSSTSGCRCFPALISSFRTRRLQWRQNLVVSNHAIAMASSSFVAFAMAATVGTPSAV
jgi:hypothetical protein